MSEYMRPDHANAHGTRKGGSIHATSGTTCPPPITLVAHRGEWSLGKVLDIYWRWAEAGDQYLGRVIVGLDPNSPDFCIMPPHFTVGLENDKVREGMKLTFGKVLKYLDECDRQNVIGMLLLSLASIIYHREELHKFYCEIPNHPISALRMLQHRELVHELSKLITTEKSSKIPAPTGIPPHVHMLKSLHEVINLQAQLQADNKEILQNLYKAVKDAIDDKAAESGHLTRSGVEKLLDSYNKKIEGSIASKIDSLLTNLGHNSDDRNDTACTLNNPSNNLCNTYSYDGKFWDVPKGFTFPEKVTRKKAWEMWLHGLPGYTVKVEDDYVNSPVKPFRFIASSRLPKKLCNAFKVSWRPILLEMSKAPDLILPNASDDVSSETIDSTFSVASEYLKSKYCCLFANKNHLKWVVSTWCRKITASNIKKVGNESDMQLLGDARVSCHKKKRKRKTKSSSAAEKKIFFLLC